MSWEEEYRRPSVDNNNLRSKHESYFQSMNMASLDNLLGDDSLDEWIDNRVTSESFVVHQQDIDESFINVPTPKSSKTTKNVAPIILMNVVNINGQNATRPLIALCDSGSSDSLMKRSSLPFGTTPIITKNVTTTTTQ